jgi:anti-anti-sigma regulatory factor
MTNFSYNIDESELPYFKITFQGEITGGTQIFSDEFQRLLKDTKRKAESTVILFNLSSVTFWDSEGMRQILGTINEINSIKDKRAYVLAPLSGYLYDRAKEKYKDQIGKTIYWIENKLSL